MRVDLGVLDPDYVNVIPNGHEPFLGFAMAQLARKPEWQEKAKAAGTGLRGVCEKPLSLGSRGGSTPDRGVRRPDRG